LGGYDELEILRFKPLVFVSSALKREIKLAADQGLIRRWKFFCTTS
jgi:hypothetical protein